MKKYSKILSNPAQLLAWVVLPLLFACTPTTPPGGSGDVLVRVYDKYLYATDLEGIVTPGSSVRDSLTMVRTFIQNWVDRELLLKKAEANLPDDIKDFSEQLEDYRNSLIIYEYEKMLLNQELDTNISSAGIQDYYDANKNNFVLKKDILRMEYLILHIDSPAVRKFRSYMRSEVPEEKDSLAVYSSKYAITYNAMEDHWLGLEEMTEVLPMESYSFAEFNVGRHFFEMNDSSFIYMVNFLDYLPADSLSPVQLVKNDIRQAILNRRKSEMIKSMRESVLEDAIEHNEVEIY